MKRVGFFFLSVLKYALLFFGFAILVSVIGHPSSDEVRNFMFFAGILTLVCSFFKLLATFVTMWLIMSTLSAIPAIVFLLICSQQEVYLGIAFISAFLWCVIYFTRNHQRVFEVESEIGENSFRGKVKRYKSSGYRILVLGLYIGSYYFSLTKPNETWPLILRIFTAVLIGMSILISIFIWISKMEVWAWGEEEDGFDVF